MSWEDHIDFFLYINLDHRKDRNKRIINEFRRQNIYNYGRISAIYHPICGHIGCTRSHIKALEYAQQRNLDTVCILEDDCIFTKSPSESIEIYQKSLSVKWDMFFLFSRMSITQDINNLVRIIECNTSSGYIVKGHYIPKLIQNLYEGLYELLAEVEQISNKIDIIRNQNIVTTRAMIDELAGNEKNKIVTVKNSLDIYWNKLAKSDIWITTREFICDHNSDSISSIECNHKMTDNTLKFEALSDLINIFLQNNQHYFLICGTLLGLIREEDFIKYDYDIDIGICYSLFNPDTYQNIIGSGYFELYLLDNSTDEGLNMQFIHKNGTKVDIDLFYNISDDDYYYQTGVYKWKRTITGFKQVDFKGLSVIIPLNYDQWLEQEYGSDFMIPKIESYDQWVIRMEKLDNFISKDY